jgi:hypothetical protein
MLRITFRPNREEGAKELRLLKSEELHSPYYLIYINMAIKVGRIT